MVERSSKKELIAMVRYNSIQNIDLELKIIKAFEDIGLKWDDRYENSDSNSKTREMRFVTK